MRIAPRAGLAALLLTASASALAHTDASLPAAHWHLADATGFALVAVFAALVVWLSRRD